MQFKYYSVVQNLEGISASDFLSDSNNADAFKIAVAMSMPPLTKDNVVVTDVSDVSRRKLRSSLSAGVLSVVAVDITYSVTYTVAESGYDDGDSAYAGLISSLHAAVEDSNVFNDYLAEASVNENAPLMLGTTSGSVSASEQQLVTDDDDEGDKSTKKDNTTLIIGVAVGVGGGCLLIAAIFAFCCFCKSGGGVDSSDYGKVAGQDTNKEPAVELSIAQPVADKQVAL